MASEFSTFVMSETTVKQIYSLPDTLQLKFFRAVSDFGLHGIEPELDGLEYTLWIGIKDFLTHTKRKDEQWKQKQRENGKKGGRPTKTQENPNNPSLLEKTQITQAFFEKPTEIQETHNENINEKENINDNEISAAIAAEQETSLVVSKKETDLTPEQLTLYHAAKMCFENDPKTKAILYQDKQTTARELKHIKTLILRCTKIAPDISADFLKNILEHFSIMTKGKLKGKAVFTPRALITPWIWELVIDSLPENESPELKQIVKGLFK